MQIELSPWMKDVLHRVIKILEFVEKVAGGWRK
jgi:hypothetical protein